MKSTTIRQVHRWVSIAFTLGVVANMIFMSRYEEMPWIGLFALVPLVLLTLTGLYLFALPYVARNKTRSA